MKNFTRFVAESRTRYTTAAEILAAIQSHMQVGEILNPDFKDITDQAKRIMRSDIRSVSDAILNVIHKHRDDEIVSDLHYTITDNFRSLNKLEKTLAKITGTGHEYDLMKSAVSNFISTYRPIGEGLDKLKGMTVKIATKRAEAKAVAQAETQRKHSDSSILIKIFESHIAEYKKVAEQRATEFINKVLDKIKAADWNLDTVAPAPNSRMGAAEYKTAKERRALFSSVTKAKNPVLRPGEPNIRVPNDALINHYIETNVKSAEDSYHAFIAKMVLKVGKPVVDAKLTGNIWTDAILNVTTNDGEEQVWHTQMIINFSKYNRMFNQFPSRRKK